MAIAVAVRPMLGSLTFREKLICGGQIKKYLLDLGDPYLEKLKAGFGKHRRMLLKQRVCQSESTLD